MPENARTPGQLIKALLEERKWTQRILAVVLDLDEAVVNRVVSDKRPVDATLALALGEVFSMPPEAFLDLQQSYDLAMARIVTPPDPSLRMRARMFGDLPISEMIKRRWLQVTDIRDVEAVEQQLCKFFQVSSITDVQVLPHAAKKTNAGEPATPAQLAWLARVRQIASTMMVAGRYSPAGVEKAIGHIRSLLMSAEEARKVPRILSEHGIRFVIVESLSAAKIDGACMWLDDFSPVVGMSLRHDRIDNFYFVLRHELEHVARRHGREEPALDTELEGSRAGVGADVPEEERIANSAAADFCVPSAKMQRFVTLKAPFYIERDILGFAKTLSIHPGLVAGQLQHKTGRYDLFRNHLTKLRAIVSPGSMVDGWGDVAPVEL